MNPGLSLLLALSLMTPAYADCNCGYTVNSTTSNDYAVFTDLFETDFLHVRDVTFNNSYSTGWEPQDYNTSSANSDGPYGMAKRSTNLTPNYIQKTSDWAGKGVTGEGNPGLQLWVRSEKIGDMVSSISVNEAVLTRLKLPLGP